MILGLIALLSALNPTPDLEDDLRRAETSMREACKSKTKLVFEWKAFDDDAAPAGCASVFPSLTQQCVNAAQAMAERCSSAHLGVGIESDRKIALALLPGLGELRCTLDKPHEAAAHAWMKAHPDVSGSSCARSSMNKAEVFRDQGGRPWGAFTLAGAVLTFAYTIEAAAPEMYLSDQMKKMSTTPATPATPATTTPATPTPATTPKKPKG